LVGPVQNGAHPHHARPAVVRHLKITKKPAEKRNKNKKNKANEKTIGNRYGRNERIIRIRKAIKIREGCCRKEREEQAAAALMVDRIKKKKKKNNNKIHIIRS
jgi:hypothetical protein